MYVAYFVSTILIVGVLGLFLSAIKDLFSMFLNINVVQDIKFTSATLLEMRKHLKDHPYFQNLSEKGKVRFIHRTINVMVNKNFIGKGVAITEAMRVRLSACVVQLTFGLKQYTLPHYDRVYVFPQDYYHPLMRQNLKGGTYANGMISFSWKDFVEGFADPTDHFNLGLHEFSHALKLEINNAEEPDERFSDLFPEWETRGLYELEKMKVSATPYLRKYAVTNIDEFFAVCIEYFFERSEEFKTVMPDLFNNLCWILNQNPLHAHSDYALEAVASSNVPTPISAATIFVETSSDHSPNSITQSSASIPTYSNPLQQDTNVKLVTGKLHWAAIIMITGPLLGIPAILYLCSRTAIHAEILIMLGLGISLANSITWKYFKRRGFADIKFFCAYSVLGVGIWGTTFLLALNFLIPIENPIQITNQVYKSEIPAREQSGFATFYLEEDVYSHYSLLNVYWYKNTMYTRPTTLTRTFQTGLFGFETLRSTTFTY